MAGERGGVKGQGSGVRRGKGGRNLNLCRKVRKREKVSAQRNYVGKFKK